MNKISTAIESIESQYYKPILDNYARNFMNKETDFPFYHVIRLMNLLKENNSEEIWNVVKKSLILIEDLFFVD